MVALEVWITIPRLSHSFLAEFRAVTGALWFWAGCVPQKAKVQEAEKPMETSDQVLGSLSFTLDLLLNLFEQVIQLRIDFK
jgi:hypothetical protein